MSISSNLQTASKSKKESKTAWQVAPNLFTSFRYAWAGIVYAVRTQRNFRIHLAIGLVALILGILLHIQLIEAAIVAITISIVLVMELMNTALESVVDLTVGQTYHELAKIAKDCAAGAVLISAIAALLVAAFIYLPLLLVLLYPEIA
ncbi:diacylglycerol kinase family protein [Leptothoe spongobia]|uniref:Diacylglycerol kinase family protein n=1 Tax=Leptothoe spongobia TAU-MAC 1115 TaxID=1967444 RepID=A0A947DEV4_9CYAN|nr:diacylglycerol kinase family protein [Leptothoe spongobia]MBT9315480.1 diacylglycerol kinase family protein [Leptothoe spongobia TAU-MAC 1115]